MKKDKKQYQIEAIIRALDVLDCFTFKNPVHSASELTSLLQIHKSTMHRILVTLESKGYLERDFQTGRYRLGLRLVELGQVVLNNIELRQSAKPYLQKLQKRTGGTLHLAILDDGEVIYIDKLDTNSPVRIFSQIGRRGPVHCTGLGKALLAYLPDDEVIKILKQKGMIRYTSRTITDIDQFIQHLREIRKRGYALDLGEHEEAVRCAAAPIWDFKGNVAAAVSITCFAGEVTEERLDYLGKQVLSTAQEISKALGFLKN